MLKEIYLNPAHTFYTARSSIYVKAQDSMMNSHCELAAVQCTANAGHLEPMKFMVS